MFKSKLLLFSVFIIPILLFYMSYCNNCIRSCISFTDMTPYDCIDDCGVCSIVDNRFTNWLNWWHTDDYTYLDTDEKVCKNNYAPIPKLKKKNSNVKPNIVLFLLDDLDEVMSPYFDAMPFARELFKLNGTHFNNAYASTPFCSPSRASLLTGMYGHNNGLIGSYGSYASVDAFRKPLNINGERKTLDGACINNENRTIALLLQKYANYKTAIFGKYINGFENDWLHKIPYVPQGWDKFDICANNYQYAGNLYVMTNWDSQNKSLKYVYHGKHEKDYLTDVISQKAVNFIETHRQNNNLNPLFLYLALTAPHFPQAGAKRHNHMAKYWDSHFDKYIKSNPSYHNYESLQTKSNWIKSNSNKRDELLNMKINTWHSKKSINLHRLEFRKRMTTLYSIDEMIHNVYNKIQELDELNNTVFVLASDHGFNMGAFSLYHKMSPNDESSKIPLYLAGKNIKKNYVDSRMVLLHDLTPTFLNMAGFHQTKEMDGIDLMSNEFRNNILIEYGKMLAKKGEHYTGKLDRANEIKMVSSIAPNAFKQDVQPYIALKNNDYLFVNYYNNSYFDKESEYELYDVKQDPHQLKNVFFNSSYSHIVMNLKNKLNKLATCSNKKECIS